MAKEVFSCLSLRTASSIAVAESAATAAAITLPELLARADLQTRLDRKYLLAAADFASLTAELHDELQVLDIDGRRSFAYESQYFDTPSLLTYREHLANQPRRFKLRTRSYLDSGQTMFEVKLEGPFGETIKRRSPHPTATRARLNTNARAKLRAALEGIGRTTPDDLRPACRTAYRRTTFLTHDGSARMTCDHDLVCADAMSAIRALDRHVLVEVKSAEQDSVVDHALARLGVDEVSISKYCVGVALLHPHLPSHRWRDVLNTYFGRTYRIAAA